LNSGSFNTITQALQIYAKACRDETFQTIGKKMLDDEFKIYLIALVINISLFLQCGQAADRASQL
jgi:hypothetical protein